MDEGEGHILVWFSPSPPLLLLLFFVLPCVQLDFRPSYQQHDGSGCVAREGEEEEGGKLTRSP
jgi:hypothetical protein